MSVALEIPQRVRDAWAQELADEQHAAEVAQARAEREQALRDELAVTLPEAHANYLAAKDEAEDALARAENALAIYAQRRAEYVNLHARAVGLDCCDHVREPALDTGRTLHELLVLASTR